MKNDSLLDFEDIGNVEKRMLGPAKKHVLSKGCYAINFF